MIQLRSLLPEQMENADHSAVDKEVLAFAQRLLQKGLISSRNKKLTATQEHPMDYVEDLAEVVRNAVMHWVDTENSRGGR